MNSKYKGIALIIVAIAILIFIVYITFNNSENQTCKEHENTISALQEELIQERSKNIAAESNTEQIVCQKAEFFLDTFYNSENQSQAIENLMTESAFQKLYTDTPHGDNPGASDYSVTFSELHSYYKKIDDMNADVLILADMSVNFSSGSTTAPILFQVKMTYDQDWLVSEILQNSMVNLIN